MIALTSCEEGDRLEKLRRSYDGDDAVDESYVVLTIGASLIATLGLLPTTLL